MELVPDNPEIFLRLGLAVVFGGVIGLERQWQDKPAGLRTHMMVSLGAAAFTLVAIEVYVIARASGPDATRVDPLRTLQGLIGGLGFIGAGTILRTRGTVRGLTTAASVWVAGALGAACGGGHYVIAGATTVFSLVILALFGILEHKADSSGEGT